MEAHVNLIAASCLIIVLIWAAAVDIKHRKIPNFITLSLAVFSLLFHGATGGWSGIAASLGGLAVGAGFLAIPYFFGGTGAGDVKLLGAVGAAVGISHIVTVIIYTAVCGLLYTFAIYFVRKWRKRNIYLNQFEHRDKSTFHHRDIPFKLWVLFEDMKNTISWDSGSNSTRSGTIAYAVPVAIGTLLFIAQSIDLIDWV